MLKGASMLNVLELDSGGFLQRYEFTKNLSFVLSELYGM